MKTFLIVAERNYDDHIGEEYDSILEVDNEVISGHGDDNYGSHLTPISEWHKRIRGRIRKLWHEDDAPDEEKGVHIYLDAASPFNAMLIDLQIVMNQEEGILIELPYLGEEGAVTKTTDPETLRVIEALENR